MSFNSTIINILKSIPSTEVIEAFQDSEYNSLDDFIVHFIQEKTNTEVELLNSSDISPSDETGFAQFFLKLEAEDKVGFVKIKSTYDFFGSDGDLSFQYYSDKDIIQIQEKISQQLNDLSFIGGVLIGNEILDRQI